MGNVITGTDLAIDVGKNYKGKLNIHGKTEQKTRSGKNLLKNSNNTQTINGVTFTVNTDGSITANGTSGASKSVYQVNINTPLNANTKYTLSGCSNGSTSTYLIQVALNKNGTKRYLSNSVNPVTFTASEQEIAEVYIIIYENATVNNVTFYPQIEEGSTATEYEQYGASPSPDYPSPIENVEGKNKFDINQEKEIFGIMLYKYSYYLKPNTKYTISSNCPASTTANIYANSTSSNSAVYINKNQTIQSDENGYFYILVRFKADASDNSTFNLYEKVLNGTYYIQIEEGTVATPYVPYNSLEFKVEGKNRFDKSIYTNSAYNGYFLKNILKVGQNYTISFKNIENKIYGFLIKSIAGAATISDMFEKYSKTAVTFNYTQAMYDKGYTLFIISMSDYLPLSIDEINNMDIQLEEGSTATDYEPYKSQVVTFPLGEEKLMEGSYLADDGIHHTRKQYVFTGQENWNEYTASGEYSDDLHCYFGLHDVILNSKMAMKSSICSHFKNPGTWVIVPSVAQYGTYQDNPNIRHRYFITNISTLAEWKKWLSDQYANGTPITVEYELAEPETVPYTAEQQETWNEMQDIYLYEGKNYINFIGTLKPELELEYLKIVDDCDFYISENGHLVIPEHSIDYLIDLNASNIPSMPEAIEASVRIVGKDGDVTLNTTYEPMNFSIVCYTDDNLTPQEKVTEEQKINRFIDSMKNETKVFAIEKDEKFYEVKYNGVLTTVRFPAHIQFTIPIKSSESYAMDLIKKRIKGNNSENSNTIKDVGAIFTILGPAQTPKISFNNYEMFYDNVLLENTKLIIDSNKSTVTHVNGVTGKKTNAMRYYNHQFPKVKYGENVLVVNSGIDNSSQVKVEWNDLKL